MTPHHWGPGSIRRAATVQKWSCRQQGRSQLLQSTPELEELPTRESASPAWGEVSQVSAAESTDETDETDVLTIHPIPDTADSASPVSTVSSCDYILNAIRAVTLLVLPFKSLCSTLSTFARQSSTKILLAHSLPFKPTLTSACRWRGVQRSGPQRDLRRQGVLVLVLVPVLQRARRPSR